MPRQLPWKSNASRTQTVKPPSRPPKTSRIPDDIDDDFFHGTVLASSKDKGKSKAASDSEEFLPDLPEEPSTPRTKQSKNTNPKDRALSSSPPLLTDYALPHTEPMRKGVSKFDLRDDEWMMVEDEFLETAKLFTRHLHIAEYDRLKASIEAKKKEAEVARPVVAGAKRSVGGAMKERAKVQDSKQRKAIRDVFASQGDESEEDRASYRPQPSGPTSTIAKPRPAINESQDTDSDDLDVPRVPKPKVVAPIPTTAKRSPPAASHIPKPATSSFAKPALPAKTAPARPRAKAPRITPFDMLDGYTPPNHNIKPRPTFTPGETRVSSSSNPCSQSSSSGPASSRTPQTTTTRPAKPPRSLDLLDEWGATAETGGVSKEIADRVAKRRAEREREGRGKKERRGTDLDDIPTFLF
ncbi:uncharacterized protein EKO05_0001682 [Ascochyta rabiei]|uniref:Uncharacterized protein n=1 Tax=Didymella rabiei TaxID=5454 RepID=A0A163BD39_DIDRA|nr:uncharacterized protein EKO05_0001682 [Ascochyta rabiei]KZM21702.1 hypothetical protein ST47_g7081 [Ascochyta rabiei]UPX11058.1 hypothetical protein EKO05_0001682 [Ascochyta rabiei]